MLIPRWILYFDRLYVESQLNNRKDVKIVFIVGIKKKADRLVKNRLNFGNIRKSVLYFQKTDLRAIYYKYYGMGYEKLKACEDKPPMCEICEKDHYINNYTYNMIIYKNKKGRRCLYDLIKYGNYISMG